MLDVPNGCKGNDFLRISKGVVLVFGSYLLCFRSIWFWRNIFFSLNQLEPDSGIAHMVFLSTFGENINNQMAATY